MTKQIPDLAATTAAACENEDLLLIRLLGEAVDRKLPVSEARTLLGGGATGNVTSPLSANLNIGAYKIVGYTGNRAIETDLNGNLTISAVTKAELNYLTGVTSAIQTQLNAKAAAAPGYTANMSLVSDAAGNIVVGVPTRAEVAFLSGVTSAIQTQLNAKAPAAAGLTGNMAVVSDAAGNLTSGTATRAELNFVAGVTSAIQTQFTNETNNRSAADTLLSGRSDTLEANVIYGNGSRTFSGNQSLGNHTITDLASLTLTAGPGVEGQVPVLQADLTLAYGNMTGGGGNGGLTNPLEEDLDADGFALLNTGAIVVTGYSGAVNQADQSLFYYYTPSNTTYLQAFGPAGDAILGKINFTICTSSGGTLQTITFSNGELDLGGAALTNTKLGDDLDADNYSIENIGFTRFLPIVTTGFPFPVSGSGIEIFYSSEADTAAMGSIDRSGPTSKPLTLYCSLLNISLDLGSSNAFVLGSAGLGIGVTPFTPLHVHVGTGQNCCIYSNSGTATIVSFNDANDASAPLAMIFSSLRLWDGATPSIDVGPGTVGFFSATPVGQASAIPDCDTLSVVDTVNAILAVLRALGLIAT